MKFIWLALLLGYCSFIFFLSHQPTLPVPALFLHQDKLFHAAAYGIMALFAMGYFTQVIAKYQTVLIVTLVFSSIYGISDEWHQSFVEGREADIYDWFADTFGAVLTLFIANKFRLFER